MRKIFLITLTLILVAIVGLSVLSCNDETKKGYTLELTSENDYFEFTVGEIDWSTITFLVYDDDGVLEIKKK